MVITFLQMLTSAIGAVAVAMLAHSSRWGQAGSPRDCGQRYVRISDVVVTPRFHSFSGGGGRWKKSGCTRGVQSERSPPAPVLSVRRSGQSKGLGSGCPPDSLSPFGDGRGGAVSPDFEPSSPPASQLDRPGPRGSGFLGSGFSVVLSSGFFVAFSVRARSTRSACQRTAIP
jgi:hypothetical protein